MGSLRFFFNFILSGIDLDSNRNEYDKSFLGVKAVGAQGWQPCQFQVPIVWKSWEPQPPGVLAVCGICSHCNVVCKCVASIHAFCSQQTRSHTISHFSHSHAVYIRQSGRKKNLIPVFQSRLWPRVCPQSSKGKSFIFERQVAEMQQLVSTVVSRPVTREQLNGFLKKCLPCNVTAVQLLILISVEIRQ